MEMIEIIHPPLLHTLYISVFILGTALQLAWSDVIILLRSARNSVCCVESGNAHLKSWHYDRARFPVVLVKKKLKAEMLNRVLAMAERKVGPEYSRLTKCLEAYNEIKRPTHSGICFGESPIRSPASLLKKTRRNVQQLIRAFVFYQPGNPTNHYKVGVIYSLEVTR